MKTLWGLNVFVLAVQYVVGRILYTAYDNIAITAVSVGCLTLAALIDVVPLRSRLGSIISLSALAAFGIATGALAHELAYGIASFSFGRGLLVSILVLLTFVLFLSAIFFGPAFMITAVEEIARTEAPGLAIFLVQIPVLGVIFGVVYLFFGRQRTGSIIG